MNFKFYLSLALVAFITLGKPVFAADFSAVITDLYGKAIPSQQQGKPLTLGDVSADALLAQFPDEANLPGTEKVKRFDLAVKVAGAKELKLSAEDTALLKSMIAKAYGPLIVGRSWALLDPVK